MQIILPGKSLGAVFLVALAIAASAQQPPAARAQDVSSINAIIAASYAAISHTPGKNPDLERFRSLFRPEAQLINLTDQDGKPSVKAGTIEQITKLLQSTAHPERGHYEKEIARRTQRYGNLAHVWSTYRSSEMEHNVRRYVLGINSISLAYDGRRWWIVSAEWKSETQGQPIPRAYLPHSQQSAR